ncbi:bcl-2-interacting killer isoform X1 [Sapajus apella]|uniref:Bcl-2-interacting killer isoform X1 n=1 Tax=Sapajus apella TaxID=9515 RepID=A0A6J3GH50_SAPAP|nr:bcl-2-interacting killer isoform X1 [Sapajus apella]
MSEVRPLSSDILMETLLCEQFMDPLTMEVVGGGSDPEEDLDPVEDPLECMENSDALALQLACIADQMDVSLRARRLAQLYEVAMYSPGLAVTLDQTDIRDVLGGIVDVFANFQEDVVRLWRSLSSGSWVRALRFLYVTCTVAREDCQSCSSGRRSPLCSLSSSVPHFHICLVPWAFGFETPGCECTDQCRVLFSLCPERLHRLLA